MKISLIANNDFVPIISIHLLLFHKPFNDSHSLCVVSGLQFLSQLNFVSIEVEVESFSKCPINDHGAELSFGVSKDGHCLRLTYPFHQNFVINHQRVDEVESLFLSHFI